MAINKITQLRIKRVNRLQPDFDLSVGISHTFAWCTYYNLTALAELVLRSDSHRATTAKVTDDRKHSTHSRAIVSGFFSRSESQGTPHQIKPKLFEYTIERAMSHLKK